MLPGCAVKSFESSIHPSHPSTIPGRVAADETGENHRESQTPHGPLFANWAIIIAFVSPSVPSRLDLRGVGQTPNMTTGSRRRLKIQIDHELAVSVAMCELRPRSSPWRWIGPCWSMLYVRE